MELKTKMTLKVAVLASGRGSDFEAIATACNEGKIDAKVVALITDNPQAGAIEKAKKYGVQAIVVDYAKFASREEYEKQVLKELDAIKPELVALAGYMRLIRSKAIFEKYGGKIINIHPSLLPSFVGGHAQRDAFEYGAKVSGYTIHFVDESLDGGAVIWQEAVDISGCRSADEVAAKILQREHEGLPKVVGMFAKGMFRQDGRRVEYTPK